MAPTECVRERLGVFVASEEAFRESISGLPSAIHGSPWQPARTPALRRPTSRKWAPRRVLGIPRSDIRRHFRTSKDELRSTSGHRRARQVSDPAALIKVVYNNSFPGVGGSGRRPSRIRRPRRGSGVGGRVRGGNKGRIVRRRTIFRVLGEGGWGAKWATCVTGAAAGGGAIHCSPLAPRRFARGLGMPWLDQGAPQGAQGSFRDSRKRFRVSFSTLQALLSVQLGVSESSTSLGPSEVDRS